jgi:hypothetical protein
MTTALLTFEEIEALPYKECKAAIKLLNKTYNLDMDYHKLPKEHWDLCDDIANTLLWLEDRIARFDDPRIGSMDPTATVIVPKEEQPKKAPILAKRVSMQGIIYDSVKAASLKTGIKKGTIHSYIKRKPDLYFYIEHEK